MRRRSLPRKDLPEPKQSLMVLSDMPQLRIHLTHAIALFAVLGSACGGATLKAGQAEVRANIAAYGYPDVCEFVPGFFSDSLPGLRIAPAAIVMDVDLISSGRDCLKHLWPCLVRGGCVFTHEAESDTYLEGLMDPAWWRENLGQCPPLVFGAGSSLSPLAEGLALFQKNKSHERYDV